MATHAHIHVHHGKTQVWNRGGVQPRDRGDDQGCESVENLKQLFGEVILSQQGAKVLGIPIGKQEYVQEFLAHKTRQQQVLFQRIPWVNDTPICVSPHVHVWAPPGQTSGCVQSDQKTQKILPDDMTRMSGRASARSWAFHMRQRHRMYVLSTFVIVSLRFGIGQRSSCSSCCTLGQLGRIPCEWSDRGTLGPQG